MAQVELRMTIVTVALTQAVVLWMHMIFRLLHVQNYCCIGPMLVMCGGRCTGARAAKARYERQAQRRKKLGKKILDKNWRNSSYACTCDTE